MPPTHPRTWGRFANRPAMPNLKRLGDFSKLGRSYNRKTYVFWITAAFLPSFIRRQVSKKIFARGIAQTHSKILKEKEKISRFTHLPGTTQPDVLKAAVVRYEAQAPVAAGSPKCLGTPRQEPTRIK